MSSQKSSLVLRWSQSRKKKTRLKDLVYRIQHQLKNKQNPKRNGGANVVELLF